MNVRLSINAHDSSQWHQWNMQAWFVLVTLLAFNLSFAGLISNCCLCLWEILRLVIRVILI